MGLGIQLPELSRPETSRPEISVLLLPLGGLIVRFREKSQAGMRGHWFGRRLKNGLPLQSGAVDSLTQQFEGLLHGFRFVGNQSIGRRWLAAGRCRDDANACRLRHAFGLFLHCAQKFFPACDGIGRKNQRLMRSLLFLVSVTDSAIRSLLVPGGDRVPGLRALTQLKVNEVVLSVVSECGIRCQRDNRETQLLSGDRFRRGWSWRDDLLSPSGQPVRQR